MQYSRLSDKWQGCGSVGYDIFGVSPSLNYKNEIIFAGPAGKGRESVTIRRMVAPFIRRTQFIFYEAFRTYRF
jgi:hypothetical protein